MSKQPLPQRVEGATARALMRLPAGLLRILAGRPVVIEGQTLDVQIQLLLKLQRMRGLDGLGGSTPEREREKVNAQSKPLAPAETNPLEISETRVSGADGAIPARVYRPSGVDAPAPALVFYHGGGFVIGSLDSHDGVCRALADWARCVVVSIDYRLAPEHPAPAALNDSIAAFRDIAQRADRLGIDPARIAVAGDSAGANLATAVCQAVREDTVAPCFQLLFYPTLDFARDRASMATFARGFLLEKASMDWFRNHYIPDAITADDARVSPIYGRLEGVAPAHIVTAGFDPLRDEGEAYAEQLKAAGVDATVKREASLVHGFLNFAGSVHGAGAALADGAARLARALETGV